MEYMEDMKASTEITCTGASLEDSTKASMEATSTKASMEATSTKASMEAFIGVKEDFAEVMEAFKEITCIKAFMEASVETFMDDMED